MLPDISPEELAEWEVKFSAGLEQYCEEDEVEAEPSTVSDKHTISTLFQHFLNTFKYFFSTFSVLF